MKKLAKIALIAMCAVALVVCSILGTLAYLQANSNVAKNTFTVGNVALSLDEAKVDLYGVKDGDIRTATGNEYKLIAGHTYVKDPTVTVAADSEASYVRMIVKISDIADLKAACGVDANADFLPQNFVQGWDDSVWTSTREIKVENNVATYEFRYYTTVSTVDSAALELPALFETFTMPNDATNAQIAALDDMEITVEAHAIQADGFADAAAAWAAFKAPAAN
ncbi:MAG: hypothetical protein IJD22_06335 [Clostridia bacterium]|nr:hypothetical protein [Clostridia bacterium]